jgi:hypothetical protein
MGLLEKNQVIIEDLELKLREKDQECTSKVEDHESEFKTKLEYLESENRVLKELQDSKMTSEKDRVYFHKTLRNLLLEEIERIEREQTEKENNLSKWSEHMKIEMQQERDEFNLRLSQLESSKSDLEQILASSQAQSSQNERALNDRIEHLTRHKDSLEQKCDETTKQINSLQDSLIVKSKETITDESKWEGEKEDLYKSLNSVSDILEENTKLHAQQLRSMEDGYKTTMEVLDKRIKMLNEDKRILERQLDGDKQELLDDLTQCNAQIHQLRNTNSYLIGIYDEREKDAVTEVERMRDEVSGLQMNFDSREVNYVKETRKYADNLERMHDLLQRAHERMEEGWDPMKSVSEALRNQNDSLQNQLDTQDKQMESLRKQAIEAQNSQRKDITATIGSFRNYLIDMNEKELDIEEKYRDFLNDRMDNDKISSERELDDMNKINDSLAEINDLRFKIRELEANNKQKEFEEVNSKLVKSQAELTHAKQNLVNYIQSLNTLEDKLLSKLEDSNLRLDENDEILRLRMENIRLNEENSSLVNAKQLTEADLNNRIEDITKKLFIKTEECEELHRKYSNLLNTLNSNREEEIKSWLRRQDLIKRTIEELRRQLGDNISKRNSSLSMKDEEHKLTLEEVKMLRSEASQLQKFWDTQFNEWVKEKRTLQDEIYTLRESLGSVEEYYHEATELRRTENEMLAEQRHLHKEKEEFYIKLANEKIEIESETKDLRERELQESQEKSAKIINMLREEVDDSHAEIKKLKDQNQRRLLELENTFERKIYVANEKEGTTEFHNQKLKNKLDETEQLYKELHNNENLEKIILRNQVKTISKLTDEKVEKTLLEKENIKARLQQLTSSAGLIEEEENMYKTTVSKSISPLYILIISHF